MDISSHGLEAALVQPSDNAIIQWGAEDGQMAVNEQTWHTKPAKYQFLGPLLPSWPEMQASMSYQSGALQHIRSQFRTAPLGTLSRTRARQRCPEMTQH